MDDQKMLYFNRPSMQIEAMLGVLYTPNCQRMQS